MFSEQLFYLKTFTEIVKKYFRGPYWEEGISQHLEQTASYARQFPQRILRIVRLGQLSCQQVLWALDHNQKVIMTWVFKISRHKVTPDIIYLTKFQSGLHRTHSQVPVLNRANILVISAQLKFELKAIKGSVCPTGFSERLWIRLLKICPHFYPLATISKENLFIITCLSIYQPCNASWVK